MSRILGSYNLKFPIIRETRDASSGEIHEEELRPAGFTVVLKRPRAKDMRVMDQHAHADIAGSIALIAKITNLSFDDADLLDAEDLGELGKLLGESTPGGPKTGAPA